MSYSNARHLAQKAQTGIYSKFYMTIEIKRYYESGKIDADEANQLLSSIGSLDRMRRKQESERDHRDFLRSRYR